MCSQDTLNPNQQTPITDHYRGYLPHIENKELQVITFRLRDSLPQKIIEQFQSLIKQNDQQKADDIEYLKIRKLIDDYEDAGYGACYLKDDRIASIVENALFFYHGQKYQVVRYCIMPNHVHVLIRLLKGVSLSNIVLGWKSFTAHEANKVLGRTGEFWMFEYFDRYIRDINHLRNTILYIDNNPVKAGLVTDSTQWRWCSLGREQSLL